MGQEEKQSYLFPLFSKFPIKLVKGQGSRLWDDTGKEYIDLMCGLAVTNLGHVHPKVKDKLVAQLDELWHGCNLFYLPHQERLAQLLVDNSCMDAAFFCSTGAEANEAAIKLARRYAQKIKGTDRYEIITFRQSFHGRTLATLTATGQSKVQEGFLPLPEGFVYADYNDLESVRALLSDRTCAVMVEMIQGEGGVIPADLTFVRELAQLCEEQDILLLVDEIQTGMGRTGKLFAYEHYGIEPDIITLAKGLGSGFPIGAMLGKAKLIPAYTAGAHGSTFGGVPTAMAAGVATVETMLEENLVERAAELGEYVLAQLTEKLASNPLVTTIRGKGLLLGIVCTEPVADIINTIHAKGVLVVPAGPNVIRIVPAMTISQEDLDHGLDVVCQVLAEKAASAISTI
ncbi:aspartate aminotransferase family protein [Paenibacillus sp. KN14-4R]|uniref:aspartate aminotransferase family protein n=1 Tax=Paenibacillus sp. KN14-4R TaxID=3445773 RepID=UPI003F9F5F9A